MWLKGKTLGTSTIAKSSSSEDKENERESSVVGSSISKEALRTPFSRANHEDCNETPVPRKTESRRKQPCIMDALLKIADAFESSMKSMSARNSGSQDLLEKLAVASTQNAERSDKLECAVAGLTKKMDESMESMNSNVNSSLQTMTDLLRKLAEKN